MSKTIEKTVLKNPETNNAMLPMTSIDQLLTEDGTSKIEDIMVFVGDDSSTTSIANQVNVYQSDITSSVASTSETQVASAKVVKTLNDKIESTKSQTNSDIQNINATLNTKADKTEIPNVSNFITKSVNDLVNYYKKSETYTQAEVNALVSAIPKFSIVVVGELPTTNISPTTIYLVTTGSETDNLYTEYIYVNNKWEKLGTQKVDLSGYLPLSGGDMEENAVIKFNIDEDSYTSIDKNGIKIVNDFLDSGLVITKNNITFSPDYENSYTQISRDGIVFDDERGFVSKIFSHGAFFQDKTKFGYYSTSGVTILDAISEDEYGGWKVNIDKNEIKIEDTTENKNVSSKMTATEIFENNKSLKDKYVQMKYYDSIKSALQDNYRGFFTTNPKKSDKSLPVKSPNEYINGLILDGGDGTSYVSNSGVITTGIVSYVNVIYSKHDKLHSRVYKGTNYEDYTEVVLNENYDDSNNVFVSNDSTTGQIETPISLYQTDVVNNVTTNSETRPLSAAMGLFLMNEINKLKAEISALKGN